MVHLPFSRGRRSTQVQAFFSLGAGLLAQPAERLGQSPYGTLVDVKIFGHFGFAWTFILPELFLAGVWLSNGLVFGWMIGLWR
jgi:hypothetical protein